jgi:outer membrane protein assembly factor BamB
VWSCDTGTRYLVRVAVEGERVYAIGGELVCLDHATGREIWRQPYPKLTGNAALLVHGDALLVGCVGEVACYDAATGRLRWHEEFEGLGIGPVALAVAGKAAQADSDS